MVLLLVKVSSLCDSEEFWIDRRKAGSVLELALVTEVLQVGA